jgi:DNA-directed RNA polymerase specialized sigma24 family protein
MAAGNPVTASRERWDLNRAAFERLLAALADDPHEAGQRYEAFRVRLIQFFIWEGAPFAEEQADETLNRVARRIEGGVEIENLAQYVLGVARFVLREARRQKENWHDELRPDLAIAAPVRTEEEEIEILAPHLEECLRQLAPKAREIILTYYTGEVQLRIRNREKLARSLGVSLNALRNRAMRLRERLRVCVSTRAGRDVSGTAGTESRKVE